MSSCATLLTKSETYSEVGQAWPTIVAGYSWHLTIAWLLETVKHELHTGTSNHAELMQWLKQCRVQADGVSCRLNTCAEHTFAGLDVATAC